MGCKRKPDTAWLKTWISRGGRIKSRSRAAGDGWNGYSKVVNEICGEKNIPFEAVLEPQVRRVGSSEIVVLNKLAEF